MSSSLPGDVVQRVRSGDASAFESLFRTYYEPLCRFCTRYVSEAALAEEIVQDVFARLWVRRAEWIVRTSVRSYLFGATRNGALNLRKRQAVEEDWAAASAASDPSERPDTPRRPDEVMESADAEERVRVALETLPERCRLVMQLRWRDQLSYAEIAEVMDISVKGVENQLARGLKSLRDKL